MNHCHRVIHPPHLSGDHVFIYSASSSLLTAMSCVITRPIPTYVYTIQHCKLMEPAGRRNAYRPSQLDGVILSTGTRETRHPFIARTAREVRREGPLCVLRLSMYSEFSMCGTCSACTPCAHRPVRGRANPPREANSHLRYFYSHPGLALLSNFLTASSCHRGPHVLHECSTHHLRRARSIMEH